MDHKSLTAMVYLLHILYSMMYFYLFLAARVSGENANAVCVKSSPVGGGGNPVIRVGLSRNVRVKSLHAKVNIRNT